MKDAIDSDLKQSINLVQVKTNKTSQHQLGTNQQQHQPAESIRDRSPTSTYAHGRTSFFRKMPPKLNSESPRKRNPNIRIPHNNPFGHSVTQLPMSATQSKHPYKKRPIPDKVEYLAQKYALITSNDRPENQQRNQSTEPDPWGRAAYNSPDKKNKTAPYKSKSKH